MGFDPSSSALKHSMKGTHVVFQTNCFPVITHGWSTSYARTTMFKLNTPSVVKQSFIQQLSNQSNFLFPPSNLRSEIFDAKLFSITTFEQFISLVRHISSLVWLTASEIVIFHLSPETAGLNKWFISLLPVSRTCHNQCGWLLWWTALSGLWAEG